MLTMILTAWALVAACVAIHSVGLMSAFQWIKRRESRLGGGFWRATGLLILVAGWAILLHLLQIGVWAAFYLRAGGMPDFSTAFYFSAITYTTTGYGDVLLPESLRLYGGVEALTGILMCGLSTGMFFAAFVRAFGLPRTGQFSPGT